MSKQIAVVYSNYYEEIANHLLQGATARIEDAGADLVGSYLVSGALELPTAIRLLADRQIADGYVALGCVLRGETSHYDTVSNESARGLMMLGLERIVVGNGILTCENYKQALERAKVEGKDKGGEAALACLSLLRLRNGEG